MGLKLNGATSGSIELDVPDDIGSDLNITIPGAAGTLDRLERTGNILQVVQSLKTDAESYNLATLAVSSNIIEQSITVSANSKVLIMCTMHMMATTPSYGFVLNRDGTNIGIADAAGNRFRYSSVGYSDPDRQDSCQPLNTMFLDTPGSAGTFTYGVKIRHMSSATQTVFVNMFENDTDATKIGRPMSHFTLMEVAG
jgi:hypothetical protein